jgi:hypothetical protein
MDHVVPRPDTASFNRLLTSLGLLALAAAFVIPYFFYRSISTLQIDRAELARLTVQARDVMEARQADVGGLQPYVLPTSATLIVIGIAFLVWGGRRLHGAQQRDDREALARTLAAENGVRELTHREKEVKIEAEVVENAADQAVRGALESKQKDDDSPDQRNETPFESAIEERLNAARRIEGKVTSALIQSEIPGYLFRPQVAVGTLRLDGLFLSTDPGDEDILLDVRVGPRVPGRALSDRILGRKSRYESERDRICRPWLVVVFPESGSDATALEIDKTHRRLKAELSPLGWATVVREDEIQTLPAIFDGLRHGFESIS